MYQGELDPVSGQRSAFPLASASQAARSYLDKVRLEALDLVELPKAATNSKRTIPDDLQSQWPTLNYDLTNSNSELHVHAEVLEATKTMYDGLLPVNSQTSLEQLYLDCASVASELPVNRPDCSSLATWRDYCAHNPPVILSHVDIFRVFHYLVKWTSHTPPQMHFLWAWGLLLQTPKVLDGGEIAVLRDLCRSLRAHKAVQPLAAAFIKTVGTVFAQKDMLN